MKNQIHPLLVRKPSSEHAPEIGADMLDTAVGVGIGVHEHLIELLVLRIEKSPLCASPDQVLHMGREAGEVEACPVDLCPHTLSDDRGDVGYHLAADGRAILDASLFGIHQVESDQRFFFCWQPFMHALQDQSQSPMSCRNLVRMEVAHILLDRNLEDETSVLTLDSEGRMVCQREGDLRIQGLAGCGHKALHHLIGNEHQN